MIYRFKTGKPFVFTVIGLLLASCTENQSIKADTKQCAIYEAVYSKVILKDSNSKSRHHLAPLTHRLELDETDAPTSFYRHTGEKEMVTNGEGLESFERAVTEELAYDTSSFFLNKDSKQDLDIRKCFSDSLNFPSFEEVSSDEIMEAEKSYHIPDAEFIYRWTYSTPAFSPEGNKALLYVEYYCGGVCGAGSYHLFENVKGEWVLFGSRGLWIS